MKISDVLRGLVDIVDNNSAEAPVTAGQEDNTSFTGSLKPVVLPDVQSTTRVDGDNKTPAGNDMQPEELFIPPLQMKMELLKKAVDVENIYSDGTPEQQEEARRESEGEWTGPEKHYEYVGAQTGVVEGGAKDTTEKKEESMTESERIRAIMNRLDEEPSRMAQRAHQNFADTGSLDTPGYAERVEELEDEGMDRGDAQGIADMEDMRGDYSNWKFHPSNLSEESEHEKDERAEKAGRKVTKDIEWDEKHDRCDEEKADKDYDKDGKIESEKDEVWGSRMRAAEKDKKKDALDEAMDRLIAEAGCEELDELSKDTLGSYAKKAKTDLASAAHKLGTDWGRKEHGEDELSHRVGNRMQGMNRAIDRLTRESDDCQLDELSKDTLGSYVKKASKDASELANMRGELSRDHDIPHLKSLAGHFGDKEKHRHQGINRAVDRLTREDGCQLDEISDELANRATEKRVGNWDKEWAKDPHSSDTRAASDKLGKHLALKQNRTARKELDELSKDTLGSYVKKASHGDTTSPLDDKHASMRDIGGAWETRPKTGSNDPKGEWKNERLRRLDKNRSKGIDRAVDRLARESDEMEMGWHESADAGYGTDWQIDEQAEVARMRELAGLNPVVLDELSDNFPE